MSSTAVPPAPRPSRRIGSRRARGPWWLLLFLLLGLLASWLIGRRDHDDEGSGGPKDLPIQTVALANPETSRILRIAPTSPPQRTSSPAAATGESARASRYSASPSFGPISLAGAVTDEKGNPAPDLEVRILRAWEGSSAPGLPLRAHVETTLTDDDGRYSFHFEDSADAYRVVVRDSARAFHSTPVTELRPWIHSELEPLPLQPAPTRRIRIRLGGGNPKSFGAHLRIRPQPPAHLLGPAPMRLDEKLLFPAWRVPGLDMAVPEDGVINLKGIGGGDWEAVVVAREHAPQRRTLELGEELNLNLEPSELLEVQFTGTGGEALWAAARDDVNQSWLLAADSAGVLNIPRRWWRSKATRLWRPGCPPLSVAALSEDAPGVYSMPGMGRLRVNGDIAENHKFELRYVGRTSGEADDSVSKQIDEIERLLGSGSPEATNPDRLLYPGNWRAQLHDGRGSESRSQDLIIRAGALTEIDAPAFDAEGRQLDLSVVSERDGTPLRGALVAITTREYSEGGGLPQERALARAGEDGQINLQGLPAGPLALSVGAAGHETRTLTIEVPDAARARIRHRIELIPARAELKVLLRDDDRQPLARIDALLIDRQGAITRARSDASGELLFLDLASGPHALFVESGIGRLPLDDWRWLSQRSGAPVIGLKAQRREEISWTLPRPRRYRIQLGLVHAGELPPPPEVQLSLISNSDSLGPGLYPTYDLGRLEPGVYETPPVFPGRYRVLGVDAAGIASIDLDLPSRGQGLVPIQLVFDSPARKPKR